MNEYDAGVLNDWGGGNVGWWHDYLRCELANANQHWIEQTEQLRAELTEARKPDCRMCSYFMPRVRACCVPGIDCNNGDRFEDIFNTEPVRLYEKGGK